MAASVKNYCYKDCSKYAVYVIKVNSSAVLLEQFQQEFLFDYLIKTKQPDNVYMNVPWPICDILLSPFVFLFFDDFNIFLTVANSYNTRIDSYNCRRHL